MPQKKVDFPLLQIAETEIEYVDTFNFLGIVIDKHLNRNAHTNKIANKISKMTGMLNKLKHVLPPQILKIIYLSLIQCHLNYGILTWGYQASRVFKLQKRAIRTITRSNYIAHSEPIFKYLDILKEIGTIKRFYSVYGVYYVLLHFIQSSVITKCGFIPEKRS